MRLAIVLVGFALVLSSIPGCGSKKEPPPVTQKAEGKVVYPDGRIFSTGGSIVFTHQTIQGISCTGAIKQDGTFTLHSITAEHKVPGVPEGSYSVVISPTSSDQDTRSIVIVKRYVIAVGNNNLTVVIDN